MLYLQSVYLISKLSIILSIIYYNIILKLLLLYIKAFFNTLSNSSQQERQQVCHCKEDDAQCQPPRSFHHYVIYTSYILV